MAPGPHPFSSCSDSSSFFKVPNLEVFRLNSNIQTLLQTAIPWPLLRILGISLWLCWPFYLKEGESSPEWLLLVWVEVCYCLSSSSSPICNNTPKELHLELREKERWDFKIFWDYSLWLKLLVAIESLLSPSSLMLELPFCLASPCMH